MVNGIVLYQDEIVDVLREGICRLQHDLPIPFRDRCGLVRMGLDVWNRCGIYVKSWFFAV